MFTLRQIGVLVFSLATVLGLWSCSEDKATGFLGYVEGEYLYVSAPSAGAVVSLPVRKGDAVAKGDLLFVLENDLETLAVAEAETRLGQARDQLADLEKGRRPSEVAAIEARLDQARASLELSGKEYRRRVRLAREKTISQEELDKARTSHELNQKRVQELEAELATATLGGREDVVRSARAEVEAAQARLDQAKWNLEQKIQYAPESGLVFDTFYQEGERVGALVPVAAILPPEEVKVRFYVPETVSGNLTVGQRVYVAGDGMAPFEAEIRYISPQVEFTPPVIYSSSSRAKLVVLFEARPESGAAASLHPGQPVEVYTHPLEPGHE